MIIVWKTTTEEKLYKITGYFNEIKISEIYLSFLTPSKEVSLSGHYLMLKTDEWIALQYPINTPTDIGDGIRSLMNDVEKSFIKQLNDILNKP